MNLVLARTFLEIVECGNLNKAAEQLHVTQSTVTMRVNLLEEILGQKLFIRHRSGAELTSAGLKFRRYAEVLVQVWKQAQQEIALKDFMGVINLGIDPQLWDGPGFDWVLWLRKEMPEVAVSVHPSDPRTLLHGLSQGLLDVALEYNPLTRPGVGVTKLFEEHFWLMSREPREPVKWHPQYVYVDWGESFRKAHSIAFPDEQTPGVTIGDGAWALRFILKYGGSGYFPERMVRDHIEAGRLHRVPRTRIFTRAAYVVYSERALESAWFPRALDGLKELGAAYDAREELPPDRILAF